VHKVVGEAEKGIADIFHAARTIAPCMILLDNIDILLGASGNSDGRSIGNGDASSSSDGVKDSSYMANRDRTRHKSIDRILSTLLVEIDGLFTHGQGISSGNSTDPTIIPPTVIVIATTTSMQCLDRLVI